MASERMEWVEIIEPRTKEHMYANLTTGECVWDPPTGVPVKKTDNNQWWELFDQSTSRFYYYNATSQKTVWHRPTDCDIIPLAKLQTLKQNTEPENISGGMNSLKYMEPKKKETVSIQTQTPTVGRSGRFNHQENPSLVITSQIGACKPYSPGIVVDLQTSPPSPSPSSRHHHHHHYHHHNNSHHHRHNEQHLAHQQSQPLHQPPVRRHHNHSQDSGRSSDSSISHSRTSLESGSYRLLDSPHRHHHRSPNHPPPSTIISYQQQQPQQQQQKHQSQRHQSSGGVDMFEIKCHNKTSSLETAKSQKTLSISEPLPSLGSFVSTSTPLLKKKTFLEPQGDTKHDMKPTFEKTKNGRDTSKSSYIYQESSSPNSFLQQEVSGYRSPEFQQHNYGYKAQGDKYHLLMDSGSGCYQRERTNTLDKLSSTCYSAPSATHLHFSCKQSNPTENAGSMGRQHYGCSISMSEANVRDMYEVMITECNDPSKGHKSKPAQHPPPIPKQRSFDVIVDKDKDFHQGRTTPCNNSTDNAQQPLIRSYSFVQQHNNSKQALRRRNRDDDSMHEQYLMTQALEQSKRRLSSNISSSSSSNGINNTSSNSTDEGDELDELSGIDEEKKQRNNENTSPQTLPYYGNLLVDNDHLLPLQHYILQQAKLSGCYKFGDPLMVEELDDSLDEEGERDAELHERADDDSDDQFADDEAASNQGDSSSQEYLEDHYADLGNYDTAGLATYYNTADTISRPQATKSPHSSNIVSQIACENIIAMKPISLPAQSLINDISNCSFEGFNLSGLSNNCIDTRDYDEPRKDDSGGDIEKYAQNNLNLNCGRPKGLRLLFRKKFSVRDILSWSKDPIPQPMLVVVDGEKLLKREACSLFRLVQVYMGDRKANVGMTLDGVAMEIVNIVYSKVPLRDELYVQICRQTTENPRKESLRRGWELMAVCLAFVPPSVIFEPYLEGYMNRHRDPNFQFPEVAKWPIHVQVSHYATVACKRLQRIGANGKRQPRKATIEDIDQVRLQIFRASMFGATLSEVMALQRDRFPQRELPWIQTTLTRQVLIRGGTMTEGIFRVSADADEVNVLKARLDKFEDGAILAASQDAHAPASLLKLWVRELYEPLIPDSFYSECVNMRHDDSDVSVGTVTVLVEKLPEINRRVLCHLIHFLQIFARPDVVARTKMDASNLAMVMAPNILRCTSQDPRVILENARKEMAFVRMMIEKLETNWIENLH